MPTISVVVAAYNIEDWIGRCLESLAAQSYRDFEAIVVDDGSTDGTAEAVARFADADARVKLISHERNSGRHAVRRTGAEAAEGAWVLFLDGDDELAPDMLETLAARAQAAPADMIHYGIAVVGEQGVADAAAEEFAAYVNRPSGRVEGEMVLARICDERYGQLVDWRVTQRLMRADLVKRAFSQMTDERLDRSEDAYEVFVLAALAGSEAGAEDCRGYIYHYGIGVTGASALTPEEYGVHCRQFAECYEATRAWVEAHPGVGHAAALAGMRRKMIELLVNDMSVRVAPESWASAIGHVAEHLGEHAAAYELWRNARDRIYARINSDAPLADDAELDLLLELAEEASAGIADGADSDCERALIARRQARQHLEEREKMRCVERFADEPIRIFVTSHKRVDMPASDILQMVQVGPALAHDRYRDALHDDEGDSISAKNPMYCEMTTQYWAWKNVACDYAGFCHYRRYFNFSDTVYPENEYGEVMGDYIDEEACRRYGLDDESIRACIEGYDVITTGFKTLADFPGDFATPREHYAQAPLLHSADLELMAEIAKRLHPDCAADVDAFLDGGRSCFCNMYIMRKPIFDEYCAWVFPVLDAFVEERDMSRYSREALRTPGHLAERLFNIWYAHKLREGAGWKTKELQCVHFTAPDRSWDLEPLGLIKPGAERSNTVPVVFAADDGYVPMVTTTIHSMLANANPELFYDIVVLTSNISGEHSAEMCRFFSRYPNASVRFEDVTRRVAGFALTTNNEHITNETYYRFLVQDLLPDYDKVLYLDSDLIVLGDVAELFATELADELVAAVSDIDFVSQCNVGAGERADYAREVLGMADPYAYFQAGVLVLNTRAMRKLHTTREWLELASRGDLIYNDQDVLNAECEGRVRFLDMRWNVVHNCNDRVNWLFNAFAPVASIDAYNAARADAQIVHYAGFEKPWNVASCDLAPAYWRYARETPFYEQLLDELVRARMGQVRGELDDVARVAHRTDFGRMIDALAPEDTKRRQVMRKIARSIIKRG